MSSASQQSSAKKSEVANTKAVTAKASKPKFQNNTAERDRLIQKYLPYAASIANKVAKGLSSDADLDEIISNGRLGLLEAAKRFDPSYNVDFKTFAYYRIRGAIYDGLRKTGWIPRSLYSKIKFEQAANDFMKTMAEQKKSSGDAVTEVHETVNSLASIYIISLDASEETMEIPDHQDHQIEQQAEFQKIKIYMRQAIEELPDKERKLIKLYYFQNETLEGAGAKLGLSKSWTSRLHARALGLLFKKISVIQTKLQQHYRSEAQSAHA